MSAPSLAARPSADTILVINSGSSSLKAALFAPDKQVQGERLLLQANATGIGQSEGKLSIKEFRDDSNGKALTPPGEPDKHDYRSQTEALSTIAEALQTHTDAVPAAIGHRIVHGGMHLTRHQPLTADVLQQLEQAVHFAPLHIPGSLDLIKKSEELYPGTPQFACFDTAFHQTLPEHAWRLPIPREYAEAGVRRYGFHGLSYESIVAQLRAEGPVPERLIVAHLGSGSSLAAILAGESIDTSMGFTPAGGIPMATRTGDLDPGVLIYLMRNGLPGPGGAPTPALSLDQAESLINHDSGLRGLSGGLSDMQKLEAAASVAAPANHGALAGPAAVEPTAESAQAQLALQIFATGVAKTIAAYIVSLAGLDLLVFTGGIGEHDAAFRASVVQQLVPLGLRLDEAANRAHTSSISAASSKAHIRILPAQEDLEIATHVRAMLPPASG